MLSADKRNTVVNANRVARTVIEVFDSILENDSFTKDDLRLILDHIRIYEDKIEIKAKIPAITKTLMSQTKDYKLPIEKTIVSTAP